MKNYIQDGDLIEATAPAGGVVSGAGLLVGNLFGVAASTAAEGGAFALAVEGVYELPKLSAALFSAGGKVSWDGANARCDVPGTGLHPIGVAIEPAASGVATVKVRLDGIATAAAS